MLANVAKAVEGPASVALNGVDPARALGPHLLALPDPEGALSAAEAAAAFAAGRGEPVAQRHFDAGYSTRATWLAFRVANVADRPITAFLSANLPYIPELEIHLANAGVPPTRIFSKTDATPYGPEHFHGLIVVGPAMRLDAGAEGTVLVRFKPYGIGVLPLSLETATSLEERRRAEEIKFAIFYALSLTALVSLVLFLEALKRRDGYVFVGVLAAALVLLAQIDGFWHAWLWPGWPLWNKVASFPLLMLLCAACFAASRRVLGVAPSEDGEPPSVEETRLDRALRALFWAALAPLPLSLLIAPVWMIPFGFLLLVLGLTLLAASIVRWATAFPGRQLAAPGLGLAVLVGVAVATIFTFAGVTAFSTLTHDLVKLLYLVVSTALIGAYATHVALMNANLMDATARELERTQALLEAERSAAAARRLAEARRARLAEASHDLKQPLAALRLALDAAGGERALAADETAPQALDLLEHLVEDALAEARPPADGAAENAEDENSETEELLSADMLIGAAARLFEEEARRKGLRFRAKRPRAPAEVTVRAPPIPVFRILNNLVANAVKHTERGGVVLGCRRSADHVHLDIVDTGPGMSSAELERYRAAGARGASSQGEGLGLAIAHDLASAHGLALRVWSRPGRGTRFRLSLPRA